MIWAILYRTYQYSLFFSTSRFVSQHPPAAFVYSTLTTPEYNYISLAWYNCTIGWYTSLRWRMITLMLRVLNKRTHPLSHWCRHDTTITIPHDIAQLLVKWTSKPGNKYTSHANLAELDTASRWGLQSLFAALVQRGREGPTPPFPSPLRIISIVQ